MADSGSLRVRRHRLHVAGDHSLCRRCDAVKGVFPVPEAQIRAARADLPPGAALEGPVDAQAALEGLARRLEAAHEADPGNDRLARELRATLLALRGAGEAADSDLAKFLDEFARA